MLRRFENGTWSAPKEHSHSPHGEPLTTDEDANAYDRRSWELPQLGRGNAAQANK